MSPIQISIILPVYNGKKYLNQWKSLNVDKWSFPRESIQIIYVDDGSSDGSQEWILEHIIKDQDIFIQNDRNLGVERSFQIGFDAVSSATRFCMFLPIDDWLAPNFFAEAMDAGGTSQEIAFIYGDSYMVPEETLVSGNFSRLRRQNPIHQFGVYPGHPVRCFALNYPTDMVLASVKHMDKIGRFSSNNGRQPPTTALLEATGKVCYTGKDQSFSLKHPNQVSKEWSRSGKLAELWTDWFHSLYLSPLLQRYEKAALSLLYSSQLETRVLESFLKADMKSSNPYLSNELIQNRDLILRELLVVLLGQFRLSHDGKVEGSPKYLGADQTIQFARQMIKLEAFPTDASLQHWYDFINRGF